jgi:transposase
VLKSEIEIAPIHHRLPQRIRAHAMICFMALILYRLMRQRLKLANSELSPERALAQLRSIHRHQITVNNQPLSGVSTLTKEQASVLRDLGLKRPSETGQLPLL